MSQSPTLDYAQFPRRWRAILRRIVRALAILILSLFLLDAVFRWGPVFSQHLQVYFLQKKCLNYSAPPTQIVFEDDPLAAKTLLDSYPTEYVLIPRTSEVDGKPHSWNAACRLTKCWEQFNSFPTPCSSTVRHTVFLHERTSRGPGGGQSRLVALCLYPIGLIFPDALPGENLRTSGTGIHAEVWKPGSLARLPESSFENLRGLCWTGPRASSPTDPKLRIYAGQPDPADSSHFTFDYEQFGQRDTIDGWLESNDTITLTPRRPPAWPK